jgi:hypothetical protein
MAFKYPNERLPFSVNPIGPIPSALVECETREISTATSEQEYRQTKNQIVRKASDAFWSDLGYICSSAVIQCYAQHPAHGKYRDSAKENRKRIEESRERNGEGPDAEIAA